MEEKKNFTVYMHISPSGKKYIGITSTSLDARWGKGKRYSHQVFGNAIKKYGWSNIKHVIIAEHLTEKEACNAEIYWIKYWNSCNPKYGYNVSTGGNKTGFGSKRTKEQRIKVGKAHMKPIYQFTLEGKYIKRWDCSISAANSLNINSSAISGTCLKRCNFCKGYYWTFVNDRIFKKYPLGSILFMDYVKKKVYTGKKINVNGNLLYQYNKDGKFIKKWNSSAEVQRVLGINKDSVMRATKNNGINITAGGFIWSRKKLEYSPIAKYKKMGNSINQYNINNEFIKEWENARFIKKSLGFDDSSIIKVCRGVHKQAYGYKWKYKSKEEIR